MGTSLMRWWGKMKKSTLLIGSAVALAYLMTRKSGGMSGLGYVSPQQCAQQGGFWDSFSNQCSSAQTQGQTPYSPFSQNSMQQCAQQGGYWDSYVGRCIGGGQVSQQPAVYSPYQYQQPVALSVDDLLSQGLSSGLISVAKQSRVVCKANQSQFCNTTFVDSAGKRKMNYKAAAAYVKRFSASRQPYQPAQYQPAQYNPFQYQTTQYQPTQYQPAQNNPVQLDQTMNLPYATAGMPNVETEDISWAIDGSGGDY